MTGPGAVGTSWSLGIRGTRFVLGLVTLGTTTYARWWWRLMRADNLTDHGMIRRRRAWLLVWTPSTLLLFAACLPIAGRVVIRTVGLFPMLVVLVAAVVSTVAMRRQGRKATTARPAPVPAALAPPPWAQVHAVMDSPWSDANPRAQATERTLGQMLVRLIESGMSPMDVLGVVRGMGIVERCTLGLVAESMIAELSAVGKIDEPGDERLVVWLFEFVPLLRSWNGGGVSLAVAEPAMRRAR